MATRTRVHARGRRRTAWKHRKHQMDRERTGDICHPVHRGDARLTALRSDAARKPARSRSGLNASPNSAGVLAQYDAGGARPPSGQADCSPRARERGVTERQTLAPHESGRLVRRARHARGGRRPSAPTRWLPASASSEGARVRASGSRTLPARPRRARAGAGQDARICGLACAAFSSTQAPRALVQAQHEQPKAPLRAHPGGRIARAWRLLLSATWSRTRARTGRCLPPSGT